MESVEVSSPVNGKAAWAGCSQQLRGIIGLGCCQEKEALCDPTSKTRN